MFYMHTTSLDPSRVLSELLERLRDPTTPPASNTAVKAAIELCEQVAAHTRQLRGSLACQSLTDRHRPHRDRCSKHANSHRRARDSGRDQASGDCTMVFRRCPLFEGPSWSAGVGVGVDRAVLKLPSRKSSRRAPWRRQLSPRTRTRR